MKYIILFCFLFTLPTFAKTINQDGVAYSCTKKPSCEEKLKAAKAEVRYLKKQAKVEKVVTVTKEKITYRKNRLSLMLGHGATGELSRQTNASMTSVESKKDFTVGVQYQRLLSERISLGLGGFTNGLVFVGAGYEF